MPLNLDPAAFQTRLAALPVVTYRAGETVLAAGTTSGRLLLLKAGAVEVVRDGTQLAQVSEPGAVFGELSLLLDRPHTADVRALAATAFHVADAASLLTDDPATALYVAVLLARRLYATNRALIDVKGQLQTGQPRSMISRTVEKAEELLNYSGGPASLTPAILTTRSSPAHREFPVQRPALAPPRHVRPGRAFLPREHLEDPRDEGVKLHHEATQEFRNRRLRGTLRAG
jgi:CRP-like cAMP-binding protein